MRGQRRAPRVLALAARLGLVGLGTPWRLDHERKDVLGLESSQRLGARARPPEVDDLPCQLEVDLAHAADERHDRDDELNEPERLDHLLDPRADLGEVWHGR